jgi:hypothetical protein
MPATDARIDIASILRIFRKNCFEPKFSYGSAIRKVWHTAEIPRGSVCQRHTRASTSRRFCAFLSKIALSQISHTDQRPAGSGTRSEIIRVPAAGARIDVASILRCFRKNGFEQDFSFGSMIRKV